MIDSNQNQMGALDASLKAGSTERRSAEGSIKPLISTLGRGQGLAAHPRDKTKRKTSMPREIVTLQCSDCKNRNYSTTKNKKTTTGRLEFSKFCRTCRKHTSHKEVK
jgi:large subunit ribosomal protein L33